MLGKFGRKALALLFASLLVIPMSCIVEPVRAETQTGREPHLGESGSQIVPESPRNVTDSVYRGTEEIRRKWAAIDPRIVGEQLEKRTLTSKHFLLEDGSTKALLTLTDQHYEAEDGKLYDIDTTLYKESVLDSVYAPLPKANASSIRSAIAANRAKKQLQSSIVHTESYKPVQVPFDATLPGRFMQGYRISKGNETLTFLPVGASNVTGEVYGRSGLIYPDAWAQTDVILQVVENGIKETLVLKSPAAPSQFRFEVTGPLSESLQSGQFRLQPAWLVDANGEYRDVEQTLRAENGRVFVDLVADLRGLKFPVVIDPTVTLNQPVKEGCGSRNWNNNSYNIINPFYITAFQKNGCSAYAFYKYDLTSIPVNAADLQAVLSTYLYVEYDSDDEGNSVSIVGTIFQGRILSDWNVNQSGLPVIQNYPIWSSIDSGNFLARSINVTTIVQDILSSGQNHGIALYFQENVATYIITSPDARLEIVYTSPPTKPTVLTPNGGETINSSYTISWSPSFDHDTPQSGLRYQVQMSVNGGPWFDLISLTSPGATTYTHNFSGATSTTTNRIRVRAFDGGLYSEWDESDGPFTVLANRSPNAPANLLPGSASSGSPTVVGGTTPTLQWTFSDPDPGNVQSAYQVIIYNLNHAAVHSTGWINSSSNTYTVPAGILSRGTTYYWQVKTKDNFGYESPFSSDRFIKPNSLPWVTITSYSDNQTLYTNQLTFTWSYNDSDGQAQTAYQVVGTRDNWATWSYNSGEINGTSTSHVTSPLALGTWSFAVRVKDGMEWSDWSYRHNISIPNLDAGPPTVPQNFQIINKTNSTVTLAWAASVDDIGVTEYHVFNGSNHIGVSTSTTFTATGLTPGLYAFHVKAKDAAGNFSLASKVIKVAIGDQGYYYDLTGRLDYVILPNGQTLDFHYDANGNQTGASIYE